MHTHLVKNKHIKTHYLHVCLHELCAPRDIMCKPTYTSIKMYISESFAKMDVSVYHYLFYSNVNNKVIERGGLRSIKYS